MFNQFKLHIENNFRELLEEPLLLAVSGGIDSIVLVHLCHKLGLDITIAHCNFHLRGEDSNGDQEFVEQLGEELSIPVFVAEFDTVQYATEHKVSIQIAARELRYDWFRELATQQKKTYLLTAHHLDDSMETFLINLSRGTGIEGLLGIPARNGYIRRPILPFTREDIAHYAEENQITWREDITNSQTKYLRNKIRRNILPLLKETNEHFCQSFLQTMEYLQQSVDLSEDASKYYYSQVVTEHDGEEISINLEQLKSLSSPKAYLYKWLSPLGFTAWSDIEDLINGASGKMIYSPTHVLLKNRGEFIIKPLPQEKENKEQIYLLENKQTLTQPLTISITPYEEKQLTSDASTIYVDGDLLTFPLTIRKYRSGDRFIPFGMKGTKKVSKFFKDEKFSLFDKENTWLLCSENKIVWVIGSRMDERFKIKDTTTNIIKIQINL
ncbi:tRNA lysidine(34) synthetase TilS [Myroides odoratimimus]|uniref:tRNA lysidine(34) synthetase TilS n=1 Tax=Myroides TaxID=76831 RepID=UPI0002460928|nr:MULTISPECIES: tRNA lysidine(34) synthetase TilS [Myroides]AJA69113.1 tRNA(Ile)-lysidine synthetase, N-terminal domain/tRNA(Ile)-lysidine synthetase, C-terminal domain [Myroides sp. A21]EHO13307.1 tRNA(Ile)-lysidine synthetase [Myroides odoratimimus CCUG 12901]MDM1064317.1 tRNA lysidine(34) synthetase TilS [Myroides odoratimimus]MDM1084630.1 tRNA lysidine(34) synthetase TilS [Myroides odoratimimus]MDM1094853.1 tRNA lysidine(34) synthetase TilS [Myroides odoratimimus]